MLGSLTLTALGAASGPALATDSVVLPSPLRPDASGAVLALAPELSGILGSLDAVRLIDLGIPTAPGLEVELTRVPFLPADGMLWVDGKPHRALSEAGVQAFSGSVVGEPESHVFFAFSGAGSRGWVRVGESLSHLIAEPDAELGWASPQARWIDDAEAQATSPGAGLGCETLDVPGVDTSAPIVHTPSQTFAAGSADTVYAARIAIETDFQYYQLFNDLSATEAYTQALFAATSATFMDDVDVALQLPYLALYSDNNSDPWTTGDNGGSSFEALEEFRSTWASNWPVSADLAHFLSGAPLGGGVAYLDVLCNQDFGFGASGNLAGLTPFPVTPGPLNWDYVVYTHELGHNFSSPHTHDYCPPLDECATSSYWGQCQDNTVCQQGTIMGYCHICDGNGISNVLPTFHPVVQDEIRNAVENSCLLPLAGVEVTDIGGGFPSASFTPLLDASWDDGLVFDASDAPNPQTLILVAGGTLANVPFAGGVVLPSPDIIASFAAPSSNFSVPTIPVPGSYPMGATIYVQGVFTDPSAVEGASFSNALELVITTP